MANTILNTLYRNQTYKKKWYRQITALVK